MSTLYALLVGIDAYPPGVRALHGCVNDVARYRDYLTGNFNNKQLAIEVLTDGDATYANIIKQFRSHLGKAKGGDVALFQYCGHGARSGSAPEFLEFYPDGKDEGLVCVDSRVGDGFDLADKELAVLVAELAKNDPHVAVILDCCHSGSGTRSADAMAGMVARMTDPAPYQRKFETYLDGYYDNLLKQKASLSIPAGKHILLAACDRQQTAKERDGAGIFTSTLVEVLEKSGSDLSYAELFMRCRALVRTRADDQDPQFETAAYFNAQSRFLRDGVTSIGRRYRVYHDVGGWKVECGAINGVPTDPARQVGFAVYAEDGDGAALGTATTGVVGAQKSDLALGFEADPQLKYRAEMTSLPVAPMLVTFEGPEANRSALAAALAKDASVGAALADAGADYAIVETDGNLFLMHRETGRLIQGVKMEAGRPEAGTSQMLAILKAVAQWERGLALQNLATQMDAAKVDLVYVPEGWTGAPPTGEVGLDFRQVKGEWQLLRGKLQVRNRSDQTLHMTLVYFSSDYGVHVLRNDPVVAGEAWVTLAGDSPDDYFYLEDGQNETVENFKLIVSTERVDDFLLEQAAFEMGKVVPDERAFGGVKPIAKMVHENEWFTKYCRIKVVRRISEVGTGDAPIGDAIIVKGHPAFKANLSLASARPNTRSVDAPDFYKAFERLGMPMLDFGAGTRGESANVLELTDIENAGALKDNPLRISVKVPLAPGEAIIPMVFDGEFVLLGGDSWTDGEGVTQISIDHVPEVSEAVADNRRSLGGSLKLFFFKTVLKQDNVNLLRWVEYKDNGSFEQHKFGVADKVKAAKRILLLVHGIIGDTAGMAAGVREAGIDGKFDLVLTYDYENLGTTIEATADALEKQLKGVGLAAGDGKSVTMLVHSMGGLVSRWFIERGGGSKVVDHLVMCGTPNGGSPFGKIDVARRIIKMLTELSMNSFTAAIPFAKGVLQALSLSEKVTGTLAQMNPGSQFILDLNASDDPGIRYTILAGNVDAYSATQDPFFARMLAKIGKSEAFDLLFEQQANDIAVGMDSIRTLGGVRAIAPVKADVACHHLNYFACESGRVALQAVAW